MICILRLTYSNYPRLQNRSRNCIGKNFALQEIRLELATLVKKFDFEAIPESMKDAEDIRHFITLTIWKDTFKAKVSRRK